MLKSLLIFLTCSFIFAGDAIAEANTQNPKLIKTKKCTFPKSRKPAPYWVCSGQDEKLGVSAVGTFAKSKAGVAFMEEMATANAHKILAEKVGKETLEGSKILKFVYAPNGTLYVLVGFDADNTSTPVETPASTHQK